MEKIRCGQAVPSGSGKGKKKKVKDELDHLRQAEKKKRRLEKALATSSAIRSELEKKMQKRKEEQRRLDEEGAAIAESVALHVLQGEDLEGSLPMMWNRSKRYDHMDGYRRISFLVDYQGKRSTSGGLGQVSDAYETGFKWNCGTGWSMSPGVYGSHSQVPYFEETGHGTELSPDQVAAKAFSALQIVESSFQNSFSGTDTVIFDRIMGGNHSNNEIKLYKEHLPFPF